MSAYAPIVLADGQATPTSHTFNPIGFANGIAYWDETAVYPFSDRPVISASFRAASAGNVGHKARWKFVLPHPLSNEGGCCVDTSNPPQAWFTVEVMVPKAMTASEVANLQAYLQGLVSNSIFLATVGGQGIY